jgi:co-chaperonin GroES (HSP10)
MIIPLLHRILVKPDKFHEVNKDMQKAREIGLVIPEMEDMKRAQASVDRGMVVALGNTAYRDYNVDPPIAVGDFVNYAKFAGKIIEDGDEQYICLNDEDIICVIKG